MVKVLGLRVGGALLLLISGAFGECWDAFKGWGD